MRNNKRVLLFLVFLVLSHNVSLANSENECVDNKAYWSVAFSPDGKHLAAASEAEHGCFELWEISSKKKEVFLSPGGKVRSLIYSNDGGLLYLGNHGGRISIWDTENNAAIGHMRGVEQLLTLDISDDDNYLAVGGASTIAKLLGLRTNTEALELDEHLVVDSIDISPSGKYIALAESDGLDLWDIKKGQIIHSFSEDGQSAMSVRFTHDERKLVAAFTCMPDGCSNVRVLDLNDYSAIRVPVGTSRQIHITPDDKYIVSGNTDGKVMLVDMSDLSISRVFANAGGPVTSLAISKDGHYIAAGTWNGLVKVWDLDSGKLILSNL
jgi:WD40 repeat protein